MAVPNSRTVTVHPASAQQGASRQVVHQPAYLPTAKELEVGPRNRLFLSLRSGIDSEVDYALPRLVIASHEAKDKFLLENYVDSVSALREWPEKWLDELERENAYNELLRGEADSGKVPRDALGAVPSFTQSPIVEARATYALQVLRNASFVDKNAHTIGRTSFVKFVTRFFDLPLPFLLEVAARSPEPVQHLLVLVQQTCSYFYIDPSIIRLLTQTLPMLAINTRDSSILQLIIPILITVVQIPTFPPPPEGFFPHMLHLLTLTPPPPLLEMVLDLLAAVAGQASYARTILSDPSFPQHLKQLILLLEYGCKTTDVAWDPPSHVRGKTVYNPASATAMARQAALKRQRQREIDQPRMEMFGGPGVFREVGEKAPPLNPSIKRELYLMSEPKRSIAWMHETFVYSSQAQLLQVTFWHAYRDFFSRPETKEQLLSASEVIKNVQVAFPAAQAKLWADETGERKFVIAGLGFRKGSADSDRFYCAWRGCETPSGNAENPGQLLDHIQRKHLAGGPGACAWGSCSHSSATVGHVLTHLPLQSPVSVPDTIAMDPRTPSNVLFSPVLSDKPAPLLASHHPVRLRARVTPHDQHRNPTGVAFLSALVVRGLARNLRVEIAAARPEEVGLSDDQRREKKKHLAEDRFGLPIPDSVLREEEEEEDAARGFAEASMPDAALDRARTAFATVQHRLLEVVDHNFSGLGMYLGDAYGF